MATNTARAVDNKRIELASRPDGMPTLSNFKLNTVALAPIEDGEFLVRNQWMSVDPYMRGRMKEVDSYVPPFQIGKALEGGCIGVIVESKNDRFAEGDLVLGNQGWREYWKSTGQGVQKIDPELAPAQAYLGALGMTGMTAWVGLKRIANIQSGETVFVSAASGAVGSMVAQIAKANGCNVIGSAGKQSKIDWLRDRAGIEQVMNYKATDNLTEELGKLAPDGIDVYFDNVGGEHLEAALQHMNDFGRIAACGMISTYNATKPPAAPRNLFQVIGKRIRMQGFIVRDHMEDYQEFMRDVSTLIRSERVVWEETITDGLENAPNAFIGLFEGENLGKSLVRIS
ncbi:NADP-dependent oxidoreductase [Aporhodopirellula aestuarii]|uniref:NADP-dependent oxidoreductase n=1 Tax=Aporhodopirellula aestuarii TaxID=2950107 RepID=A0ABT0TYL1_9BACT|nr:NADP-dependent oxidoreductase [Aporhodopirellula aestuarii]MCM2369666.1 NADP-dependent oxidoreductase [Aporhodopirellula aestuarii]